MSGQRRVVRRVEAVTERAARIAEDDRRLALPAGAVRRVERVDVEPTAVAVGRRTARARPEAVHRLAGVAQAAEELLALVVERLRPVDLELEIGEVTRPMRDVEAPRALRRQPGVDPAVGQLALPALQGPVRAVGRLARGHDQCEPGPVVGLAGVLERLPVELAVLPPATGVVVLEMHLRRARGGRKRVHRAPDEHVPKLPVLVRVGDERLTLRVHLERPVLHVRRNGTRAPMARNHARLLRCRARALHDRSGPSGTFDHAENDRPDRRSPLLVPAAGRNGLS